MEFLVSAGKKCFNVFRDARSGFAAIVPKTIKTAIVSSCFFVSGTVTTTISASSRDRTTAYTMMWWQEAVHIQR